MDINMVEVGKQYMQNLQRFTYNRAKFLERKGYVVDSETRKQITDNYKTCIYSVITYLSKALPEGFEYGANVGSLNYQKMLDSLPLETQDFLRVQGINCRIYPDFDSNAELVIREGIVNRAYNMEDIKSLPRKYRNKKINAILEGYSIYEVRDLLINLGAISYYNEFDEVIDEHGMRLEERVGFIEAVMTKLVLNGSDSDIARAFAFNRVMNADFQFDFLKQERRTK